MSLCILKNGELVEYTFSPGSGVPKEKEQSVGEALADLLSEEGKTPEEIVEAAAPSTSDLHPYFEWDDTNAAHAWRVQQARHLVNHFHMIVIDQDDPTKTDTMRAAFSIERQVPKPNAPEETMVQRRYVMATVAFKEKEDRGQVIAQAKKELDGWRKRYKMYKEFEPIFKVIKAFLVEQ